MGKKLLKSLAVLMGIALLFGASATWASTSIVTHTVQFDKPQLAPIRMYGEDYTKVVMPGTFTIADRAGDPAYQVKPLRLLLPQGTEVDRIEVNPVGTVEIDAMSEGFNLAGEQPIMPYQPQVPIGQAPPSSIVKNEEVYRSMVMVPADNYSSMDLQYCRGYAILTMSVFTTQYIPAEGKLFYHPEVEVKVHLKDTGNINRFYRPSNDDDRRWVMSLVDNPEVINSYRRTSRGVLTEYAGGLCDPDDNGGLGYQYVIVVRDALYNANGTYDWEDLIARKEADGLEATKVKVEDILAHPDYNNQWNDEAADIREFMKDAYEDWGTQYVLIAGDQDGSGYAIHRRLMDYEYESNNESDLYWSNLDNTFNADNDNDWGEAGDGGFDAYSELWIGSISCDTETDISNWLTKSFFYADNFDMNYLEQAAFYGGNTGWPSEGDEFIDYSAIMGLDDFLGPDPHYDWPYPEWLDFQYGFETWNDENPGAEYDLSIKWTAEPTNPGWNGGSENAAISGLRNDINNDNVTVISAIAHANADMSMDVGKSSWESNYHNTQPFFVHDYGCHCGDMDASSDGVLHAMLFHSDTELAFGCVYNTTYGWGSYYSTGSSSAIQQKSFWDYMFDYNNSGGPDFWQLGRAQAWSKDLMAPSLTWGPGDDTFRGIIQACLLFGDPAQTFKPPVVGDYVSFNFPNGRPEIVDPDGGTTIRVELNDYAQPGTGMFHYDFGEGYQHVNMTQVSPNVYDAVFPAIPCGDTVNYYFTCIDTDGGMWWSPYEAPQVTYSALSVSDSMVVWEDDFSSNQGWTGLGGSGEWEIGAATAGGGQHGNPDPANDHTPTSDDGVMGNDLGGDYSNNISSTQWITSPVIDCSDFYNVTFSFWRWLGVEQPSYDHAYIEVYNGSSWIALWENANEITDGSWTEMTYDVSAFADSNANFQIRFGIGPTDVLWQYCGWNIDDIRIVGYSCEPQIEPDVAIDMDPYQNPPVMVEQGGAFYYAGILDNNTDQPQTVDVWVMLGLPGGSQYGPVQSFWNVPLAPQQNITVQMVRQDVPTYAPLGTYDYLAYCGDYPSSKMDSAYFEFTVIAGDGTGADNWNLSGWFGDNESNLPAVTSLEGNYPNPFNPSTTFKYALANDCDVKLEVFNLMGQKVETLIDARQEAGYKQLQWDASHYASGVYFYKLSAGEKTFTKRMMLLK